jgi:hypothetical protein
MSTGNSLSGNELVGNANVSWWRDDCNAGFSQPMPVIR